jgi:hypothetical protein
LLVKGGQNETNQTKPTDNGDLVACVRACEAAPTEYNCVNQPRVFGDEETIAIAHALEAN